MHLALSVILRRRHTPRLFCRVRQYWGAFTLQQVALLAAPLAVNLGRDPGASQPRGRPGVLHTPGITAAAAAPGAAFTVMPRVGPTSPRARATVPLT